MLRDRVTDSGQTLTKSDIGPRGLSGLPGHVSAPDPSLYWSDNYVVLDFETTTEFKGSPLIESNRIIMASWRDPAGRIHSHFGSEFEQDELVRACGRADFIVAHNAKFELGWLARAGLDLRSVVVYDTLIGEYVRGGNRFKINQLSLGACLKRYGLEGKRDTVSAMLKAGISTEAIPESWLQTYCERDVTGCHELFLAQRQLLKDRGLVHIHYQRCLLTPVLADTEFRGMAVDGDVVEDLIVELEDKYAKLTSTFQDFMGGVPPSSTQQKAEYVFNVLKFAVPRDYKGKPMLTKSGNPSIASEVIERLRPKTEKQRRWLKLQKEWANMNSDLTKYLRKLQLCCKEAGGILRAQFNQCSTYTHRLSSNGLIYKIQFQNLNRKFKPIFKARRKGWLMGEADGAQIEFRVASHMGRDAVALMDIENEVDIHTFSAGELWPEFVVDGAPHPKRQEAKEHTFKPIYGGQSGTPEQRRYYEAFRNRYSGIASTQKGWTHKVLDKKSLRTEYGLIFYWPQCRMTETGYITHTTNIYNYPVQGFATAEIIPIAIVCAWHRMKNMKSFLVNTVHDSIIAEVHPDEVDLWHEIAKQCLIEDVYDVLESLYGVALTVPLGAGVMVGSHWSNAQAKQSEVVHQAGRHKYERAAREAGMI